ncbi:thiamine phosphate synthase [Granulicella arctica]|uniref:thiamine phosphate synthase n=1 Tax=Granulicella arctica TaxID=940613 RepID=UPI0021DF8BA3|nr:thiamine phosphate synthase [Granulicella arctica]
MQRLNAEIPSLYVIADANVLAAKNVSIQQFAAAMRAAGVGLLQYRDKSAGPQTILRNVAVIRNEFQDSECRLILNDRADLAVLADWSGVHVGQGDLLPEDARRVVGAERWVGLSTHTDGQVRAADVSSAAYVAVGPVFATSTKLDAEPVVGLAGVRTARALTTKPLVAIGGITRENVRSVIEAGADSVAVISGLFVPGESLEKVARDFIDLLR